MRCDQEPSHTTQERRWGSELQRKGSIKLRQKKAPDICMSGAEIFYCYVVQDLPAATGGVAGRAGGRVIALSAARRATISVIRWISISALRRAIRASSTCFAKSNVSRLV